MAGELEKIEAVSGSVVDQGVLRCECGWDMPRDVIVAHGGVTFKCPWCGHSFEASEPVVGARRPSTPRLTAGDGS